jgi:uroporphyrinogen III methyltransferase/synthase
MNRNGICYLVGAGPGDPGLVTLRAKELIGEADVLVHDALIDSELLRWAKPSCEIIHVGKRAKDHTLPQDQINALIVERSKQGKIVVRLKGGDPMIFGRGGEEAAELAAAGVPFEIVPGISSAIAGPAYAGIPVTHREHNTQLTIFTGHEDPTKGRSSLDYRQLAETPGTKVFLMGVGRLREITDSLIANGADPDTPAALIQWATTAAQRTVTATLGTLAETAEATGIGSPAVAVIGDVVRERAKINWFEHRPLFGKRVVVTRTREQAGALSHSLRRLGADVIELPTIRIEAPEDRRGFAELVTHAHEYDWIVFTSPNGVQRFFDAFFAVYEDARSLGNPRIAAIGNGTAAAIRQYRIGVDLIPERFVAEGLVDAFRKESVENLTVLWVKAAESRETVGEGLTALGAIVDECIAYRTVPESDDPTGGLARIAEHGAEVITFTSASTVDHFMAMGVAWPEGAAAGSIGPVTSDALRRHGIEPAFEANPHDIPGLVAAIVRHFQQAD